MDGRTVGFLPVSKEDATFHQGIDGTRATAAGDGPGSASGRASGCVKVRAGTRTMMGRTLVEDLWGRQPFDVLPFRGLDDQEWYWVEGAGWVPGGSLSPV